MRLASAQPDRASPLTSSRDKRDLEPEALSRFVFLRPA